MAEVDRPSQAKGRLAKDAKSDQPICGVIMPISATENHSEAHWASVQKLIHRGISDAGFIARNVWETAPNDRISERIIGNIFDVPIAVADISDLNPNVMLELGLRLASKKPTLVIVNSGGTIPFDIRDFHAIFYPSNLSILEMEEFFQELSRCLKEKYKSFTDNNYTPFLSGVVVDVASPETRVVGVNDLIVNRLDDISARLSSVESSVKGQRASGLRREFIPSKMPSNIDVFMPEESCDAFTRDVLFLSGILRVEERLENNELKRVSIRFTSSDARLENLQKVEDLVRRFGGVMIYE